MTATVFKARVWENVAVLGTGTVALIGSAQAGYRSFASCVPSGSQVCYCIYDPTTQDWETDIGTYTITTSPAGTLTRTFQDSSTGSPISFAGNSCNVTLEILPPIQTGAGSASAGQIPALNPSGVLDESFRVAFSGACCNLTSNVTLSGDTKVAWSGVDYDTNSFWSSGSPTRLTIPAGVSYVRLAANGYFSSGSGSPSGLYFQKNGGNFSGGGYTIFSWSGLVLQSVVSQVVAVTAGDYFECVAGGNTGTVLSGDFHANFGVEVVG